MTPPACLHRGNTSGRRFPQILQPSIPLGLRAEVKRPRAMSDNVLSGGPLPDTYFRRSNEFCSTVHVTSSNRLRKAVVVGHFTGTKKGAMMAP
jgi:hypothetical protein